MSVELIFYRKRKCILMRKKKTTYLGGEKDPQSEIMPKHFEKFFMKRVLILILIIVLLLLIHLL